MRMVIDEFTTYPGIKRAFVGPVEYNATTDGMRFLIRCSVQQDAAGAFGVMLNWASKVR